MDAIRSHGRDSFTAKRAAEAMDQIYRKKVQAEILLENVEKERSGEEVSYRSPFYVPPGRDPRRRRRKQRAHAKARVRRARRRVRRDPYDKKRRSHYVPPPSPWAGEKTERLFREAQELERSIRYWQKVAHWNRPHGLMKKEKDRLAAVLQELDEKGWGK